MIITYHGGAFVKLTAGDTVVALNPIGKDSKLKSSRFGADVAMESLRQADFNGGAELTAGSKTPFVISGPGAYEANDIFIDAVASDGPGGTVNTIYAFTFDNIRVCHLGALANTNLSSSAMEKIGKVDVLFAPAGEDDTLGPKEAEKLLSSLEPSLIIPVLYDKASLETFAKVVGAKNIAPVDKLTIKRKDLDGKEGELVVLSSV